MTKGNHILSNISHSRTIQLEMFQLIYRIVFSQITNNKTSCTLFTHLGRGYFSRVRKFE